MSPDAAPGLSGVGWEVYNNRMDLLSDYDYHLPPELIAQYPLRNRIDARLMVVDRRAGTIEHLHVRDLPELLKPEDCLVLNNTKVLPARLIGTRTKTGGRWEGLFLTHDEQGFWKVLSKTRGKPRSGETIDLQTPEGRVGFKLEIGTRTDDGGLIVKPLTEETPFEALERVGWVPIPPYIRNGRMIPSDKENYQTVYASQPGAIAAPTAGLHFTPPLLEKIKSMGVALCPVTLHVGAGTFKPVTVERIAEHPMHYEFASISQSVVDAVRKRKSGGGRIIAVGSTSVRVLESAAKATGTLEPVSGETDLFIRPPFTFSVVDAMLTNFHFPKSTLLILVRTFGGDDLIKRAYDEAIREKYRFYSFGDAMLIL